MRLVFFLLLAAALSAACVPAPPAMVVARKAPGFELTKLAGQSVAVWPVAVATIAPEATDGLTERYGTQDAFLDAVARSFSDRLILPGQQHCLRSDQIVTLLGDVAMTRPLLDPRQVLGEASDSRFAGGQPNLAALAEVPSLAAIRFAVMFRDLSLDRGESEAPVATTGQHGRGMTVYWARARLRIVVVDLTARSVVWDGTVVSHAEASGTGLRSLVDDLSAQFGERVYGRRVERISEPASRHR